jgi:hypothetical protein
MTLMEERFSMFSSGQLLAAIEKEIQSMVQRIVAKNAPIYSRGLAVAALGAVLGTRGAPSSVSILDL